MFRAKGIGTLLIAPLGVLAVTGGVVWGLAAGHHDAAPGAKSLAVSSSQTNGSVAAPSPACDPGDSCLYSDYPNWATMSTTARAQVERQQAQANAIHPLPSGPGSVSAPSPPCLPGRGCIYTQVGNWDSLSAAVRKAWEGKQAQLNAMPLPRPNTHNLGRQLWYTAGHATGGTGACRAGSAAQ
ncbi:MAG: hypothetical protein ACYCXA_07405 [Actinomycetes bacterium]